jgi:hypothetical protein
MSGSFLAPSPDRIADDNICRSFSVIWFVDRIYGRFKQRMITPDRGDAEQRHSCQLAGSSSRAALGDILRAAPVRREVFFSVGKDFSQASQPIFS